MHHIHNFGSGQFQQLGQIYLSPGFAKIAPWWLVRRDCFQAKAPRLVAADCATNVYYRNRRAVSIYAGVIFLRDNLLIT
jgi:hypothetical protein